MQQGGERPIRRGDPGFAPRVPSAAPEHVKLPVTMLQQEQQLQQPQQQPRLHFMAAAGTSVNTAAHQGQAASHACGSAACAPQRFSTAPPPQHQHKQHQSPLTLPPAAPSQPLPGHLPRQLLSRARGLADQLQTVRHYDTATAAAAPSAKAACRPGTSASQQHRTRDVGDDDDDVMMVDGDAAEDEQYVNGYESDDGAGGVVRDSSVRAPGKKRRGGQESAASSPSVADKADTIVEQLKIVLTALRAAMPRPPPQHLLPEDESEIWRVASTLWNHAVELTNLETLRAGSAGVRAQLRPEAAAAVAADPDGDARARRRRVLTHITWVRHLACDAATLVPVQRLGGGAAFGGGCGELQRAVEKARWRLTFSFAAGRSWLRLAQPESAEMCLSRAAAVTPLLLTVASASISSTVAAAAGRPAAATAAMSSSPSLDAGLSSLEREELLLQVFELQLTRTQVLWRLGQQPLAKQTLAECASMARELQAAKPDLSCVLTGWLAQTLLDHAVDVAMGRPSGAGGGGGGCGGGTAAASDHGLGFGVQGRQQRRRRGGSGGSGGTGGEVFVLDDDEEDEYDMYGDVLEEDAEALVGGGIVGGGLALSDAAEAIPLLDQLYELVTQAVQCHQASMAAAEAAAATRASGGGNPVPGPDLDSELDPEALAVRGEALIDLQDQVLTWLALCHMGAGGPDDCLACLTALRESGSALAEGAELTALEIRALLATGSHPIQEVVAAAEALAARPDAGEAVVWETLQALLDDPRVKESPEALFPAVAALQGRVPDNAAFTIDFLLNLYDIRTASEPGAGDAAAPVAATAASLEGLAAADRLALAVLGPPPPAQEAAAAAVNAAPEAVRRLQGDGIGGGGAAGCAGVAGAAQQRLAAWVLLWNRGCAHFDGRAWPTALRFFSAAANFAPGPGEAARAQQTRAVCLMALQRPGEALQVLDFAARAAAAAAAAAASASSSGAKVVPTTAVPGAAGGGGGGAGGREQQGPGAGSPQAAVAFLRFKLLLLTGDAEAARRLVPDLAAAERDSPGMLAIACQEAVVARSWSAAKQLLQHMLEAARRETDREQEMLRTQQQQQQQQQRRTSASAVSAGAAAAAAVLDVEDGGGDEEDEHAGGGGGGCRARGFVRTMLSEGHILRVLIRCIEDEAKQLGQQGQGRDPSRRQTGTKRPAAEMPAADAAAADQPKPWRRKHDELAEYLCAAANRLDAVGVEPFFRGLESPEDLFAGAAAATGSAGSGAQGAADASVGAAPAAYSKGVAEQLEWFAWTAWNSGLAAGAAAAAPNVAAMATVASGFTGGVAFTGGGGSRGSGGGAGEGSESVAEAEAAAAPNVAAAATAASGFTGDAFTGGGGSRGSGGGAGEGGESAVEALRCCTALMAAAGRLLTRLAPVAKVLSCRRVAHALAASAALQLHFVQAMGDEGASGGGNASGTGGGGGGGGDAQREQSALQMAAEAVRQARVAAADITAAAAAAGRAAPPADKCDVLVTCTELRILLARHAPPRELSAALEAAARRFPPAAACPLPGSSLLPVAQYLAGLAANNSLPPSASVGGADAAVAAATAEEDQESCRAAAVAAFQQVLQRLTAAADVDFERVAEVVRSLLALAGGDDAARLAVLRELAGLLVGAAAASRHARPGGGGGGGYPSLEMEALISNTWNRGAHHARFGRLPLALEHLRTALSLLRHAAAMDAANRSWMAEEVSAMEARMAAAATATAARRDAGRGGATAARGGDAAGETVSDQDLMAGWAP